MKLHACPRRGPVRKSASPRCTLWVSPRADVWLPGLPRANSPWSVADAIIHQESTVVAGFVPLLSIIGVCVRTHTGCLRARSWQLPPTPRAPDPATTPPTPSLFSPFFRLSSRRPTCAYPTSYFNPLPLSHGFEPPLSDADPVKWIPTVRGQKLYPITTAFIFMTQEAAGELGLYAALSSPHTPPSLLLSLSLRVPSFKLGN